ncbi:OPT family small oligopeptide transporter [Lobosporangium transversale]|uniref:OPT family small oligopeptide transporter n=1 Tax=Lobosporangium transversale TaxID=64571 RepID=A0A1Y2GFN5_9FUNG|nr:OPT family small oligopeptide transporter [Lobosporangium transversale]ORZ09641.1 OPT family small oligopeptide transporter [Lobosporangium transversale]|eukprot:XP_021878911.1 OPT family small oligopeptide transporter [Lobosporangium transversale]
MASEQKQEYDIEKEFVDDKHDVERSSVALEEEENSPIPEVAAIVSNKDNPSLPVLTFRYWVMAVIFALILSFFNQFFFFRTNPMTLSPMVIQLLSYPVGKFMARVLPHGPLNPGPFSVKEHVLVSVTANCASGTAYAVDITVIQRAFYGEDFGFLANFLLILCTQMLGFGMAGVLRRYLVYPAAMIWPANLVQVALFNTLHKEEELAPRQWSRFKFFLAATFVMFLYSWIPGFLFPVLSSIAWICWIKPDNLVLSQLTGAGGLGIGTISLDWNTIVAFLGSPLIVPWWAQVNIALGFFVIAWVMVPIAYYTNLWDAKKFPILTPALFTRDGHTYDTQRVLTNNILDEKKYDAYGPLRISTFFALTYGIGFAGLASMITHTWLYHRHKLVAQWKQSREHSEDIHHRLMQAYPEVPDWWYAALFVLMTVIAVITCEIWDYKLPWWGVLLAVAMSAFFALPVGLIQAVTNQQIGLNIITEYAIGYILPGRAIANVTFKTLGYISMAQALLFTVDLKLGHYMKIPPRAMFWAQLLGTFIAGLVNLLTANWLLGSIDNICAEDHKTFSCPHARTFYSASVIWGAIAPDRMFGPTSIYNAINYFFLIGFVLPIPFYYLKKKFPNTMLDYVHIPVLLGATSMMPPARAYNYTNWLALGFIFQFFARRYHPEWHLRYTYVLSAAFDSGTAFMLLLSFFIFTIRDAYMVEWWGTRYDLCPLESAPYITPPPLPEKAPVA